MSEAKHTPGPWKIGGSGHIVCDAGTVCIVSMRKTPFAQAFANGRLIAEAPCLLKAAERLLPRFTLHNPSITDDFIVPIDVRLGDLRELAAAIAKATGAPK